MVVLAAWKIFESFEIVKAFAKCNDFLNFLVKRDSKSGNLIYRGMKKFGEIGKIRNS